jgi:transposase
MRSRPRFRGRTAEQRRQVRNTSSRRLLDAMKPWLEIELGRIRKPQRSRGSDPLWLCALGSPIRFLDGGRIELDNNPVERAIRPIALGRKNHLLAGSDRDGIDWATCWNACPTATR